MPPRHVLHFHPAERRQIRHHPVQVGQHIVELNAAVSETEILLELVQDPPRVDRQAIAHVCRDAAELVQRLPQTCLRMLLEQEGEQLLFQIAQRHWLSQAGRQPFQGHEHLQQRGPTRSTSSR